MQNLIEQDTEIISNYITNLKAKIYISGRSKDMPNEVENAFDKCGIDVDQLRLENRYIEETWG